MVAEHIISGNVCAALGQLGKLGHLYDAHSHRVLQRSILKSRDLPAEAFDVDDKPGLDYKYARADTLTDRLSILEISGDFSLVVACGLVKADLAANYVCNNRGKASHRRVATNCKRRTKFETLLIDRLTVDQLNIDVLKSSGATHVITGIEWGSQTIITAEIEKTEDDEKRHLGGAPRKDHAADEARNYRANNDSETGLESRNELENNKAHVESKHRMVDFSTNGSNPLAKMLRKFGDIKLGGDFRSTDEEESRGEKFEFEITTDIADHSNGSLPTTYDGVLEFLETTPSRLSEVNEGKGVPLCFHLIPIEEIAGAFQIQLQHHTVLKELEKSVADRIVGALDTMEAKTRELERYRTIAKGNAFCLPKDHVKEARKQADQARNNKRNVEEKLRSMILEIRKGNQDSKDALNLFQNKGSDDSDSDFQPAVMDDFSRKIEFATSVVARGARYMKYGDGNMQDEISKPGISDLYVMEFARSSETHEDWSQCRQHMDQLLEIHGIQHRVLVVDLDVTTTATGARPVLKRYRGGICIEDDIIGAMEKLAQSCLVKCNDDRKVDRTRTKRPPSTRRVVRLACPGPNCFQKEKSKWICPTCHEAVEYGYPDFYCKCSRYPSSSAVFRCGDAIHGPKWTMPDKQFFASQLRDLPERPEYNILLLGKTGSGKSTFINAFCNYIDFSSLEEALSEQKLPLRHLIPGAFKFDEERLVDDELAEKHIPGAFIGGGTVTIRKNHRITHSIKIGTETNAERLPTGGRSATRSSQVYSFVIGDIILKFIDTPGMGDTDGLEQDRKNVKNILYTLESVHKLSAVLFLLESGDSKTTTEFRFCITELLSQLHIDASKNILFAYTKAEGTGWGHGDASDAVASIINELGAKITLNPDNQFVFDSAAYRYLAACKYMGRQLEVHTDYASIWNRSADSVFRLVKAVQELKVHEVQKTLRYNRVRAMLEDMAKPLTEFALCMQTSKTLCEKKQRQLEEIDNYRTILLKLTTDKVIPIRHNLEKPKVVCSHRDCDPDEACHDKCDIDVLDDDRPNKKLEGCYAFRKSLFWHQGECHRCKHDSTYHVRRSYYFTEEVQPHDEKSISHYRSLLDNGVSEEEVHKVAVKDASEYYDAICKEEEQLKTVQAKLGHYVGNSAAAPRIANRRDATVKYLQLKIESAKTEDDAARLEMQKSELEERMMNLENAVNQGTAEAPDEEYIESALKSLHEMKIFGSCLENTLKSDPVQTENQATVQYKPRRSPAKTRSKKAWKSVKSGGTRLRAWANGG